jgi:lipoprotein-anchoring transpeptidase ErfK/SrfK
MPEPEVITGNQNPEQNSFQKEQEVDSAKNMVLAPNPKSLSSQQLGKLAIENYLPTQPIIDQNQRLSQVHPYPNYKKPNLLLSLPKISLSRRVILLFTAFFLSFLFIGGFFIWSNSKNNNSTALGKNLYIAGLSVEGKSPENATKELQSLADTQKISLTINNQKIETTASEIGISRNIAQAVSEAQNKKKTLKEKLGIQNKNKYDIALSSSVDQNKLKLFVSKALGDQMLAKDASVSLDGETFVVNNGQKGLSIDYEKLSSDLNLIPLNKKAEITAQVIMVEPSITTEAANKAKQEAEQLIAAKYTVGHPSLGAKLLGNNLKTKWIVFSPDSNKKAIAVSINQEAAWNDFVWLTKLFNQGASNRIKVNIPGQGVTVIDEGRDGINMSDEEINKQKSEFLNKLSQKETYEANINPSLAPRVEVVYDGQKRMVLVDAPRFRAYAFENGQTLRSVPITTGKTGFETPTGTYLVQRKIAISTMKACSNGECWSVPNIKWQSYFTNEGHAIHATTAPSAVGRYNISHGCVGMYENDAKWFYDWAVAGTPVVIVR